jgi:hypothetical protein
MDLYCCQLNAFPKRGFSKYDDESIIGLMPSEAFEKLADIRPDLYEACMKQDWSLMAPVFDPNTLTYMHTSKSVLSAFINGFYTCDTWYKTYKMEVGRLKNLN